MIVFAVDVSLNLNLGSVMRLWEISATILNEVSSDEKRWTKIIGSQRNYQDYRPNL